MSGKISSSPDSKIYCKAIKVIRQCSFDPGVKK